MDRQIEQLVGLIYKQWKVLILTFSGLLRVKAIEYLDQQLGVRI